MSFILRHKAKWLSLIFGAALSAFVFYGLPVISSTGLIASLITAWPVAMVAGIAVAAGLVFAGISFAILTFFKSVLEQRQQEIRQTKRMKGELIFESLESKIVIKDIDEDKMNDMVDNANLLGALPAETLCAVNSYLPANDQKALNASCRYTYFNLQPEVQFLNDKLNPFLTFVANGEQEKVQAILNKADPILLYRLLTTPGQVTDFSGRTFKSITAVQYAFFALDAHMLQMFRDEIVSENNPTLAGLVANQVEQHCENGTEHGVVFDRMPLLNAYLEYSRSFNAWTYEQREEFWVNTIGKLQLQMPAHFAQEFCRKNRPFHPTPAFNDLNAAFDRTLTMRFDALKFDFYKPGFETGIGLSHAVVRGNEAASAYPRRSNMNTHVTEQDRLAFEALYQARVMQTRDIMHSIRRFQPQQPASAATAIAGI